MSLQKKILEAPAEGDDEQMGEGLVFFWGGGGGTDTRHRHALGVSVAPVGSWGEAAGQEAVSKAMEVASLEKLQLFSGGTEEF